MIFDLTKNVKITLSLTICLANSFVLSISDFDSYINHITKNQSNPTVLYPVQKTSQQKYEERIKIDSFVFAIINYTYSTVDGKEIPNSSEQGRYGEGRVQSAHGVLVHVTMEDNIDDHSACTHAITGTNRSALPSKAWIALVRRGKCTFEDKVQNVWLRGAVGIIVYNDKNSKELEKMQIRDKQKTVEIPSKMISPLLFEYFLNGFFLLITCEERNGSKIDILVPSTMSIDTIIDKIFDVDKCKIAA